MDGSRVLVVEDDSVFRDMVAEFLRRSGIPSDQTRDRDEALRLARSRPYAAALIDLNLDRCHGVDVGEALRAVHPSVALVFVSGDLEGFMRGRRLPPGSSMLKKPLDLARLRALLDEILHRPAAGLSFAARRGEGARLRTSPSGAA